MSEIYCAWIHNHTLLMGRWKKNSESPMKIFLCFLSSLTEKTWNNASDSVLPKDASQVARWLCNYGNRIVPSLLIIYIHVVVPLICKILRDRFKKSDVVLRPAAEPESVRRLPFPPSLDWDIHFLPPLLHPASHSPLLLTSHPHSEQSVSIRKFTKYFIKCPSKVWHKTSSSPT